MVSKIERGVDEIGLQIYEEIKDMTPQEQTKYFNKRTEELSKNMDSGFTTASRRPTAT
ncbi:MAG: hypothetical protein FWD81_06580 [Methanomassiliicoccaceae archaeon]|nr:hypothetical protein [Methanomassiliicoccaceae archaeon]